MIKIILVITTFILILYYFLRFKKESFENQNTKKNIIVTGSTSGIGKVLVNSLDKDKYNVIIHGKDNKKLKKILYNCKKRNLNAFGITLDLSKKENIQRLVSFCIKKLGKVDILVNNFYDSSNRENIEYQITTNLSNTILLTEGILKIIRKGGKVINVSSSSSDLINYQDNFLKNYTIIKSSIEKYTKLLASKHYSNNIAISCLKIDSTYTTSLTKKTILKNSIFNLFPEPYELVKCFNFLLTSKNKEITGRVFLSSDLLLKDKLKLEHQYKDNNKTSLYNYFNDSLKNKKFIGENYYAISPMVKKIINFNFELSKYTVSEKNLKQIISKNYHIKEDNIAFHQGTINFLEAIINKYVKDNHEIITTENSCGQMLEPIENKNKIIQRAKCKIVNNTLVEDFNNILNLINSNTRLLYLIYPLNIKSFDLFLKKIPTNLPIIIDYCYDGFFPNNMNIKKYINSDRIIIFVNTFSKFYGLASLNLSFSIARNDVNIIIRNMINYPLSPLKEAIAVTALLDKKHQKKVRETYHKEVDYYIKNLKLHKIEYLLTNQVFIYLKINKSIDELDIIFKKKNINLHLWTYNDYIPIPINDRKMNKKYLNIIKKSNI